VFLYLQGLIVGDGLCEPETMFPAYAPFMYNIGLLDENQRDFFAASADNAVTFIKAGKVEYHNSGVLFLKPEGLRSTKQLILISMQMLKGKIMGVKLGSQLASFHIVISGLIQIHCGGNHLEDVTVELPTLIRI